MKLSNIEQKEVSKIMNFESCEDRTSYFKNLSTNDRVFATKALEKYYQILVAKILMSDVEVEDLSEARMYLASRYGV